MDEFFNVCAAALGPLTRSDLGELLSERLSHTRWSLLTQDVGRFIIGDGSQDHGYVFSHPRLAAHFWEAMESAEWEQQQWEALFLAWGEKMLQALNVGTLNPKAASRYLVQHYGAHLERAAAPDHEFYALVSEGWMRAWEALEGTHAGYLNDVERAWRARDLRSDPGGVRLVALKAMERWSVGWSVGALKRRQNDAAMRYSTSGAVSS